MDNHRLCKMNHINNLIRSLYSFYKSKEKCDVIITVENKSIQAHKLILSAGSDYFKCMFNDNFIESNCSEINIKNIEYNYLQEVIDFIYSGNLNTCNDIFYLQKMIETANFLCVYDIVTLYEKKLEDMLSENNCINLYIFSHDFNLVNLKNKSHSFLINNLCKIYKLEDFKLIEINNILLLLKDKYVNVPNEDTIVNIILNWINNDKTKYQYIDILLSIVKLSLVSSDMIQKIKSHESIINNGMCNTILNNNAICERPRKSTMGSIIIIGNSLETSIMPTIEQYDLLTKKWKILDIFTSYKSYFSVTLIENILYIIGGVTNEDDINDVIGFNIKTKEWFNLPSLNIPRSGCGVVVANGKIYAIGGYSNNSYTETVEYWEPGTDKWMMGPSLNYPKNYVGVTELNGDIYTVGGSILISNPDNYHKIASCDGTVELLKKDSNQWKIITNLPIPRSKVSVVSYNGFIYTIGGYYYDSMETKHVFKYDPSNNKWLSLSSMNIARSGAASCIFNEKIYVIGGSRDKNSVSCYNIKKNTWKELNNVMSFKYCINSAMVSKYIY
nr:kelch-like protein [Wadden Sea poxvirus]